MYTIEYYSALKGKTHPVTLGKLEDILLSRKNRKANTTKPPSHVLSKEVKKHKSRKWSAEPGKVQVSGREIGTAL